MPSLSAPVTKALHELESAMLNELREQTAWHTNADQLATSFTGVIISTRVADLVRAVAHDVWYSSEGQKIIKEYMEKCAAAEKADAP